MTSDGIGRALVRHVLSRRVAFRGRSRCDGQATLLVVNYRGPDDTRRLIASWQRFVSDQWSVLVVENSGLPSRRQYPGATRVVGGLVNLHHGLGLDFGLRFVSSEYVVICDPDSIIVSTEFWPRMRAIVDAHGAGGIDMGMQRYRPICLAFRTEIWKRNLVSMEPDWSRGWDVGDAFTDFLGGVAEGSLLCRSRSAGRPIPTAIGGLHYVAEVYEEIFSNTLGASRIKFGDNAFGPEEGPLDRFRSVHTSWRAWADQVIAGQAAIGDFDSLVGIPA